MKIQQIETSKLIPYENNPRKNDASVKYLVESIKEFGFKNPILADKNNVVIAGHTRLKAANEIGIETLPVIIVDDLDENEIKALRLVDNKVSEFAGWDFSKLERELEHLDFDMEAFGFFEEAYDIDAFFNDDIEQVGVHGEKEVKALQCPFCGEVFEI